MNELNDPDHGLGVALRERVGQVHPDLLHLASAARRAGTRIRRRRQAVLGVGALAVVGAVGGFGAAALTSGPAPVDAGLGFASAPAPSPTLAETTAPGPAGVTCALKPVGPTTPLSGAASSLKVTSPAGADMSLTRDTGELAGASRKPSWADSTLTCVKGEESPHLAPMKPQKLPVTVGKLLGWTFGTPGDDKFPASKAGHSVSVNVRPLSDLKEWSGGAGSDRPRSQVVHVGKNYIVTLQPAPDTPPSIVKELKAGLRYAPKWIEKP